MLDERQIERLEALYNWLVSYSSEKLEKIPQFPIYTIYELRKSGVLAEEINNYFSSRPRYENFRKLLKEIIEIGEGEFLSSLHYYPSKD